MAETIMLTTTAKAAGCAAKLSPSILENVLKRMPPTNDPNLIVGFETSDDAAVYRISDDLGIVQTVDFFTPIVDDPFLFGQVAAANALSDVYAMGGRPITALTIVAFPASQPPDILEAILRGGLAKMNEARCTVAGGHSIRDDEMKFGYAVTGLIDPARIFTNAAAQASTASMTRLNRDAADALHEIDIAGTNGKLPVHAVTDVTGFSLLGHAREVAIGSGVSLRIDHSLVEYLPGAIEAARARFLSGGLANNRAFLEGCAAFLPSVSEEFQSLLFDPQTSGGLLVSIAPDAADRALASFQRHGVAARKIGEVIPKRSPLIEVV